jgi:hypothetical protein
MAKAEHKKQKAKPEKPRAAIAPHAPDKGDEPRHVAVAAGEIADDLARNTGIGASKGTTMAGADADDLDELMAEAENTFKGDVENDAGRPGMGIDPKRRTSR